MIINVYLSLCKVTVIIVRL